MGMLANAVSAGEVAPATVSGAEVSVGLATGTGVSATEAVGVGSAIGSCVGLGSQVLRSGVLRSEFEEPPHPKKDDRINTVPRTPTMRFVLLSDFKLHGLNDSVYKAVDLWH